MADDEKKKDGEEAGEAQSGGKSWLLIVIAAVVSLLIGSGATYFLVSPGQAGGEAMAEEGGEAAKSMETEETALELDEASDFRDRVLPLEPFVVNVSGEGRARYLKVKVELEAEDLVAKEEVDARLAQVRDTIILLLSSKRLSDVSSFEGKAFLKDDIKERVNGILEKGHIRSVLFTEFVVQ